MSSPQAALRQFLAVEGVRTATIIDMATGMIVRSVGKPDPDLPATAPAGLQISQLAPAVLA